MILRAAALLALALAAPPAPAQDDPRALARAALARLDAASDALAAARASGGQARIDALTQAIRGHEDGLAALRAGLRALAAEERARGRVFAARSGEVSRLLGALAGIERAGARGALVHPDGPLATARAAMIVGAVTPALQAEAAALRADLDALAAARLLHEDAARRLAAALAGLQAARADLAQAMGARRPLPPAALDDPARLAALLQAADTLAAFAEGLADLPRPPTSEAAPAATPRPGALPLPAAGTVLRRFGEVDPAGVARPGVTLATLPDALVTAPVAGSLRYVGPLLDYGNVMILEPAADILLVLAGLGEAYVDPGEIVAAGTPLGLMSGRGGRADGDGPGAPGGAAVIRSETLYIEVRQDRRPVDPATWFAMDRQE